MDIHTARSDGPGTREWTRLAAGPVLGALLGLVLLMSPTPAFATPTVPDLDPASDTGRSNTDDITNDDTPTFFGTAIPGDPVDVFANGVLVCSTVAGASGAWSCTSSSLIDGVYVIEASDTGGLSLTGLTVTIDTVAPADPLFAPDLDGAFDTGVSDTDNITSIKTPQFDDLFGDEPFVRVRLQSGGFIICVTEARDTGSWECTTSGLADGVHSISYFVEDIAGNVSGDSPALSVTIDSTPPQKPTIDLQAASDSGRSSTDNITRAADPLVFDLSAEVGSSYVIKNGNTVISGPTTVVATPLLLGLTLAEGTFQLSIEATDTAGNRTQSGPITVVVDRTAPVAPGFRLTPGSDTGAPGDMLTSTSTPAFGNIGVTTEPFATVRVTRTGPGNQILCTTVANELGQWECQSTPLADGVYVDIRAEQEDAAGNLSLQTVLPALTIDSSAPGKPTIDLQAASDSGPSQTDNITNDGTPTFDLTGEANATTEVKDGEATVSGPFAMPPVGSTSATLALGDGAHHLTVVVTDAAGNVKQSPVLQVIVDTAAPSPPTVDLLAYSDTGSSSSDDITSINNPAIGGTAEPNARVRIYSSGLLICQTVATSTGIYECTTEPLASGTHSITAEQEDAAGNVSAASSVLAITIDSTAPQLPSIDLQAASDSGSSNTDNITSASAPVFDVTADPGSEVIIKDGSSVIDGPFTMGGSGKTSRSLASLAEGTHPLTAEATDAAGNVRQSELLQVTIDRTAPLAPSVPDLQAASDDGPSNTDNITRLNTPVFQGTGEANIIIRIFADGLLVGQGTVRTNSSWEVRVEALRDGNRLITAQMEDLAGNVGPASASLTVRIEFTGSSGETMHTKFHELTATAFVKGKATVTSTVDIFNVSGGPVPRANVFVRLTLPGGKTVLRSAKTNAAGRALIKFIVKLSGTYTGKVEKVQETNARRRFTPGAADTSAPIII